MNERLMIDGNGGVQFQVDQMGQIYILFDNGSMAVAEQQHIIEDESDTIKVKIIKWMRLENKD